MLCKFSLIITNSLSDKAFYTWTEFQVPVGRLLGGWGLGRTEDLLISPEAYNLGSTHSGRGISWTPAVLGSRRLGLSASSLSMPPSPAPSLLLSPHQGNDLRFKLLGSCAGGCWPLTPHPRSPACRCFLVAFLLLDAVPSSDPNSQRGFLVSCAFPPESL